MLIPAENELVETKEIVDVLGGRQTFGGVRFSIVDLNHAVSEGLPKATLRNTVRHVFTDAGDQLRAMYKVVPEATFKRRRDRLSAAESERTERLARVVATAEHVWGPGEDAQVFLTTAHPELGGKTPMEAALTELGARHTEEVLFKILYGLPA